MKKKAKSEWIAALTLILSLALFISFFSAVTLPKRKDYGSTWSMFLAEEENSIDVLLMGSSIAYCDVVPAIIWEETGLRSYLMAGPEQTIPITYYYLRECLRTQSPRAIALEVTGTFFGQYKNYTAVNIGYMPWTSNRFAASITAAEPDVLPTLLCPLYAYHGRWAELSSEDFTIPFGGSDPDSLAGYTFLSDSVSVALLDPAEPEYTPQVLSQNLHYLQKIVELCNERDIAVLLYISPNYWQRTEEEIETLHHFADVQKEVVFLDFNDGSHPMNLDPATDFFDVLHLNYRGAEKFSRTLSSYLVDSLALSPVSSADTALWNSRAEVFYALCAEAETPEV